MESKCRQGLRFWHLKIKPAVRQADSILNGGGTDIYTKAFLMYSDVSLSCLCYVVFKQTDSIILSCPTELRRRLLDLRLHSLFCSIKLPK